MILIIKSHFVMRDECLSQTIRTILAYFWVDSGADKLKYICGYYFGIASSKLKPMPISDWNKILSVRFICVYADAVINKFYC